MRTFLLLFVLLFSACQTDHFSELLPLDTSSDQTSMEAVAQGIVAPGYESFACVTEDDQPGITCSSAASSGCRKATACNPVSLTGLDDHFTVEEINKWPNLDIRKNKAFIQYLEENQYFEPTDDE